MYCYMCSPNLVENNRTFITLLHKFNNEMNDFIMYNSIDNISFFIYLFKYRRKLKSNNVIHRFDPTT